MSSRRSTESASVRRKHGYSECGPGGGTACPCERAHRQDSVCDGCDPSSNSSPEAPPG